MRKFLLAFPILCLCFLIFSVKAQNCKMVKNEMSGDVTKQMTNEITNSGIRISMVKYGFSNNIYINLDDKDLGCCNQGEPIYSLFADSSRLKFYNQ